MVVLLDKSFGRGVDNTMLNFSQFKKTYAPPADAGLDFSAFKQKTEKQPGLDFKFEEEKNVYDLVGKTLEPRTLPLPTWTEVEPPSVFRSSWDKLKEFDREAKETMKNIPIIGKVFEAAEIVGKTLESELLWGLPKAFYTGIRMIFEPKEESKLKQKRGLLDEVHEIADKIGLMDFYNMQTQAVVNLFVSAKEQKKINESLNKTINQPVSEYAKDVITLCNQEQNKIAESIADETPGLSSWQEYLHTITGGAISITEAVGVTIATKSTTVGAFFISAVEASDEYNLCRTAGGGTEECKRAMVRSGAVTFLLEKIGLEYMFGLTGGGRLASSWMAKNWLRRGITTSLFETGQEELQTLWQNINRKLSFKEGQELSEGWWETAVGIAIPSFVMSLILPGISIKVDPSLIVNNFQKQTVAQLDHYSPKAARTVEGIDLSKAKTIDAAATEMKTALKVAGLEDVKGVKSTIDNWTASSKMVMEAKGGEAGVSVQMEKRKVIDKMSQETGVAREEVEKAFDQTVAISKNALNLLEAELKQVKQPAEAVITAEEVGRKAVTELTPVETETIATSIATPAVLTTDVGTIQTEIVTELIKAKISEKDAGVIAEDLAADIKTVIKETIGDEEAKRAAVETTIKNYLKGEEAIKQLEQELGPTKARFAGMTEEEAKLARERLEFPRTEEERRIRVAPPPPKTPIAALKERIRMLARGAREGKVLTKKQIKAVQTELIDLLKKSDLSLKDKAKFIAAIKNIQTPEQLAKRLPEIEERIRKLEIAETKRTLLNKILKALKKTAPKKVAGKPVGKFTPEIQKNLDMFREAIKLTSEQAELMIQENLARYKDTIPPYEVALENKILSLAGGIRDKTNVELREVLSIVTELVDEGRLASTLKKFNKDTEIQQWRDRTIDIIKGVTREEVVPKKVKPPIPTELIFKGYKDLTTNFLEMLKGRAFVSKAHVGHIINEIKGKEGMTVDEENLIKETLEEYTDATNIPVKELAQKIKMGLLPLEIRETGNRYVDITLRGDLQGNVADYNEIIYESPIATTAGNIHFNADIIPNYFAHVRVEEMGGVSKVRPTVTMGEYPKTTQNTRRIIELQSDLFQKGKLEEERMMKTGTIGIPEKIKAFNIREAEISKLQPFQDIWHERIIREEIKRAAEDGKTKLLFPTGETAMQVEGLGEQGNPWGIVNLDGTIDYIVRGQNVLTPDKLKIGMELAQRRGIAGSDRWIITDLLGEGKFKAVPKERYNDFFKGYDIEKAKKSSLYPELDRMSEQFDISGKIDTLNPIYKFYEGKVQRYLKKIGENFKQITDPQGVSWFSIDILKKFAKEPIGVFKEVTPRKVAPIKSVPIEPTTKENIEKIDSNFRHFFATLGKDFVGMWDIMDMLSFNVKEKETFLHRFGETLDQENANKKGDRKYQEKIRNMFIESYDIKSDRDMLRKMRSDTVEESLGSFKDTQGKMQDLVFSKAEARKRWMELQDPTLKDTFVKGMYYTEEMIDVIDNSLSAEDKILAQKEFDFYQEYYKTINPIYSDIYGINLPHNPKYSPIKRGDISRDLSRGFGEFGQEIVIRGAITKGALKSRVRNIKEIEKKSDVQVLQYHVAEMEHWKAWVKKVRDLNSVFGDSKVRQTIVDEVKDGKGLLRVLDGFIKDFTRGGVETTQNMNWLDKFRGRFTRGVLMVKPSIAIKQLVSWIAFADDVSIKDFTKGEWDFWRRPVSHTRTLLTSDLMQSRGKHMERDIKTAMESESYMSYRKKPSFLNSLMLNIQLGDKAAIIVGGWSVYKFNYDNAIKKGLSHDEAHKIGIRKFELSTKKAQQSADLADLSQWQRGNSAFKLFTMFKSTVNQYFRKELGAVRNLAAQRITKRQFIKTMAIFHFILPMLFQWISDFGRWDKEEQLRAAWLGNFNGIFIIGDGYEWIIRKALGMREYDLDIPIVSIFKDMGKIFAIDIDDITTEDLLTATEGLFDATGKATGLPTGYVYEVSKGIGKALSGEWIQALGMLAGWSEYIVGKEEKKMKAPSKPFPEIKMPKIKMPKIKMPRIQMPKITF